MHVPQGKPPGQKRVAPKRKVVEVINEFQSDLTALDRRAEPLLARITLYTLVAMVLSFALWASLSTLDKVVTARAAIETTVPKIVIQPLETAIIKTIEVQPGDMVRAGQVLATLDPTFIRADAEQVQNRVYALEAQIARMDAEHNGKMFLVPKDQPGAIYYQLQKSLYDERQLKFASRLKSLDEKIAQVKSAIVRRERDIGLYQERLKVAREVEDMRRQLMQKETGSRLNYLVSQNDRLEIERNLELTRNALIESRHELASVIAERDSFISTWETELLTEMASVRSERDGLLEQLQKALKRSDLVVLQSPQDGTVLDVVQRSVGSVIREAEPFFRLVPKDAPLEVVAYLEARHIGTVAVGDPVEMKLDAFPYMEHGLLRGVVRSISADSFTGREAPPPGIDPGQLSLGATFYKARIEITENALIKVPDDFRLIPGMTLSAEIKIGVRSVLSYLLRPMFKSLDEGMREP